MRLLSAALIGLAAAAAILFAVVTPWRRQDPESPRHRMEECALAVSVERTPNWRHGWGVRPLLTGVAAPRSESLSIADMSARERVQLFLMQKLAPMAQRPLDCRSAFAASRILVDRAQGAPAAPPDGDQGRLRHAFSRAAFSPDYRWAVLTVVECRTEPDFWNDFTESSLYRREGETWRRVGHQYRTLLLRTNPYPTACPGPFQPAPSDAPRGRGVAVVAAHRASPAEECRILADLAMLPGNFDFGTLRGAWYSGEVRGPGGRMSGLRSRFLDAAGTNAERHGLLDAIDDPAQSQARNDCSPVFRSRGLRVGGWPVVDPRPGYNNSPDGQPAINFSSVVVSPSGRYAMTTWSEYYAPIAGGFRGVVLERTAGGWRVADYRGFGPVS